MSQLIFCDEFGNTGGNLLDPVQPVLVYAFLLLPAEAFDTLTKQVQLLLKEGVAAPSELKSLQLLKSSLGRRRFEAIGTLVRDAGARVLLSIVEKRYQACSLIRDTYLDPFEHDSAPPAMAIPQVAQRFSDACYDTLSNERLERFLSAIDDDVPERIAAVGREFSAALRLHRDDFVSHVALCMETHPERVFRRGMRRDMLPKNAHIPASQFAAFHPGLERVEGCLQSMADTGALLRDHDAHFGPMLDWAYKIGRELDQHSGGRAYGAQQQLDSITSCSSASSEQQLGIQLADLAAGVVGRVARDVCLQSTPSEGLPEIAGPWLAMLLNRDEHYVMVSDARLVGMSPALFGLDYAPSY